MRKYDVIELTKEEMYKIQGGDKFMGDLGKGLGTFLKKTWNFISTPAEGSDVLMNCI